MRCQSQKGPLKRRSAPSTAAPARHSGPELYSWPAGERRPPWNGVRPVPPKSCSIDAARASRRGWARESLDAVAGIKRSRLGRVITAGQKAMAFEGESAMPFGRVGSRNRSARRNSCCTWLRGRNRSENRWGPRKGDRSRFTSCGPTHPALAAQALRLQQAGRPRRQQPWLPLAQAQLPPNQQPPGWGSGSSPNHPLLRHAIGHDPQPARSQPSATALPKQAAERNQHPDHTSSISQGAARYLATEILRGTRGVRCRDSALLTRAAARPAA